ncbi:putative RNA-directed DNA polymerase, partial [Aphis craccivora]
MWTCSTALGAAGPPSKRVDLWEVNQKYCGQLPTQGIYKNRLLRKVTKRKLIDMFNDLKSSQNKIMSSINSCYDSIKSQDKKLASFDSKFDLLSNQIVSVIEENELLKSRIEQLESKLSSVEQSQSNIHSINQEHFFSEFMDRQFRSRISTKPLSVHRLRKPSSKPRPIRIVVPSPSVVFQILKVKRQLSIVDKFKTVRVSSDQTLQQPKLYSSVAAELKTRKDAVGTRDVITRGGGVLIAVKSRFSCRRLPILDNSVEQLFIQISEKSLSLVIGAVYIPPASDINVYDTNFNAIDVLLNNNCHSKFLIFGDYNLPNISWKSVNGSIVPSDARAVFDINVINENHTLLPLDSMYHPALSLELPVLSFKQLEYNEQMYDFVNCDYNNIRSNLASLDWNGIFNGLDINDTLEYNEQMYDFVNCDYNSIRSNLASLDWNGIFNGLDINDTVNIFYENVFKIINTYCPVKTVYLPKHPHWFSSSLKKLIRDKKISHKAYKQSPNSYNYNKFSYLRSCCKAQNKIDYNIFIQKTQNSITSNPKLFWKYVNSKRSTHSLPNSMYYNNDNISGDNDITNCFAQYFSSVLNMPSILESISDYYNASIPSVDLNSCTLSLSDVYNELNEITYSTCSGPDKISNT